MSNIILCLHISSYLERISEDRDEESDRKEPATNFIITPWGFIYRKYPISVSFFFNTYWFIVKDIKKDTGEQIIGGTLEGGMQMPSLGEPVPREPLHVQLPRSSKNTS